MNRDKVEEREAGDVHRRADDGEIVVLCVKKRKEIERDQKKNDSGGDGFRLWGLAGSKPLKNRDACHQNHAHDDEEALRGVEGVIDHTGENEHGDSQRQQEDDEMIWIQSGFHEGL